MTKKSKKQVTREIVVAPKRGVKRNRAGRPKAAEHVCALSPVSSAYALAMKNPWTGPLVGCPSYPPVPSQKLRLWSRGSFSTGTTGVAAIVFNPSNGIASDRPVVSFTTTAYTGSATPTAGGAGVTDASTNSIVPSASFGANLQWRCVAAGIRVWFTGATLSAQGSFSALVHPDNESTSGLTQPALNAFPSAMFGTFEGRQPIVATWVPTRPSDLDYKSDFSAATPSIAVLTTGPASTAGWCGYDVCCIYEMVGSGAAARTMNRADPEGLAAVLSAAEQDSEIISKGNPVPAARSLLNKAWEALKDASGPVAEVAGKFAGSAVAAAAKAYTGQHGLSYDRMLPRPVGPTITEVDKRSTDNGVVYHPAEVARAPLSSDAQVAYVLHLNRPMMVGGAPDVRSFTMLPGTSRAAAEAFLAEHGGGTISEIVTQRAATGG